MSELIKTAVSMTALIFLFMVLPEPVNMDNMDWAISFCVAYGCIRILMEWMLDVWFYFKGRRSAWNDSRKVS